MNATTEARVQRVENAKRQLKDEIARFVSEAAGRFEQETGLTPVHIIITLDETMLTDAQRFAPPDIRIDLGAF